MFLVFYTVKIVYTCVCMTCSTSYCLCDTLMNPWNVCIYVYIYIYMYVCMYVSDFAMSLITYPADFVSTNAQQPLQEVIFEVSIKIIVCYIQVIY